MVESVSSKMPVLIVDDDKQIVQGTSLLLRSAGMQEVVSLTDSREVIPLLHRQEIAVVLLDLQMPHLSGRELLEKIKEDFPEISIIIITAHDELETAISCMQAGAFDYLVKPIEKNRLTSSIRRAIEISHLKGELSILKNRLLNDDLVNKTAFDHIITRDKKLRVIFQYIEAISASGQPVLITGQTGTGKELFARSVHLASKRQGEFIAVNVAGLDDTVFSDTLFGHVKGAFTGADQKREGLISQATGGTLFLDEIGDLNLSSQIKLLRLVQDQSYYPLGSDSLQYSAARIVVATNTDLNEAIQNNVFRKDLYYRLRAHQINLPTLQERKNDLPVLLNHFVKKACLTLDKKQPVIPQELYILLNTYSFPGNVRELETMTFDAVARNQSNILSLQCFKEIIGEDILPISDLQDGVLEAFSELFPDKLPSLKQAERLFISEAMKRAQNNQGIAANMLGISRQALNKRLVRERKGQT